MHDGKYERITALADDLVRSKASVIVTWAIPVTQVVKNATSTIPIVMAGGGNPVETGLVASLAKPGGNITGLATIQNELTGETPGIIKGVFSEDFPRCHGLESRRSGSNSRLRAIKERRAVTKNKH